MPIACSWFLARRVHSKLFSSQSHVRQSPRPRADIPLQRRQTRRAERAFVLETEVIAWAFPFVMMGLLPKSRRRRPVHNYVELLDGAKRHAESMAQFSDYRRFNFDERQKDHFCRQRCEISLKCLTRKSGNRVTYSTIEGVCHVIQTKRVCRKTNKRSS